MDKKTQILKEAIIELYLDVKVRTNEEYLSNYNQEKYEEEKGQLMGLSPLVLLGYIRSSFEVLTSIKEEVSTSKVSSVDKSYEELVQELEKEAREHIRIEQQLRLYIETLQNKIEEVETKNKELDMKVVSLEEKLKLLMISIKELKKRLEEEVPKYMNKSMEDNPFVNLSHMKRISELVKKYCYLFL
jgi:chromosome segregation ATPase